MDGLIAFVQDLSGLVWGGVWNDRQILPVGPLALLLLGVGIFLMIRLRALPIRRFLPGLAEVWRGRKAQGPDGAITPWQSLTTALSGQVGTGNLAGVATAITLGGPGAIFWMWVAAFFGMALAFAESSLAVAYRRSSPDGRLQGGPMIYIADGMGPRAKWLAWLFAIGALLTAVVTGSMIQANSITETVLESTRTNFALDLPRWSVGGVLAALTFVVVIGGIRSIGSVAGKLVPTMALFYLIAAAGALAVNAAEIPDAFMLIVTSAFGVHEVIGGVTGYSIAAALRAGVSRGLFSNEAGQGSAPIAHAAAQTNSPKSQGEVAMIGVFVDTMVICTMTALVILTVTGDFKVNPARAAAQDCLAQRLVPADNLDIDRLFPAPGSAMFGSSTAADRNSAQRFLSSCESAGLSYRYVDDHKTGAETAAAAIADGPAAIDVRYVWQTDASSSAMTTRAFANVYPSGEWIVTICLIVFAFTTILGWSYYGEQAAGYLFGNWSAIPFRVLWIGSAFLGCLFHDADGLWLIGDVANAAMATPNLIALIALSGVVVTIAKTKRKSDRADKEFIDD